MLTDAYTFLFGDAGVVLNTDDNPTAPFVDIVKVSGLDNADYRITDREREGMDGGFTDSMYEKMRIIILDGFIYNTTEAYLDILKANFAPAFANSPFYFVSQDTSERVVFAKSMGMRYNWDAARRLGVVPVQFQLKAEDPTIYGPLAITSTTLRTAEAGTNFNMLFNFGFTNAVAGSTGVATIDNPGNKDADCTFEIIGPITDPFLIHDNTSYRLNFSITLSASDVLKINLRNKSVILNDSANRRGSLLNTSRWFLIKPGVNTVRFFGTAGAGTPQLNCSARPAYR